tara:strand:+ start:73 stop:654 length:582 start_codon:yes stop_codon:yes gene_type:complete
MVKPTVNILNFKVLYNILFEIKGSLNFNLNNLENEKELIEMIENKKVLDSSIILTKKKTINPTYSFKNIIVLYDLPVSITDLLDKINICLLKQKYNFQSNFNVKSYKLDLNSRTISKDNKKLKLTEREIDIILFIYNNKEPQSVETLQRKVWGYSENLETHTVETHIYRLRKKIGDEFKDEEFLISHKKGYSI